MAADVLKYGPQGPDDEHHDYIHFPTHPHLIGYAEKIKADLINLASLYNGKEVVLYKLTGTERCPKCTNSITGEILVSNCQECHGTGKVDAWTRVGEFWAYIDFGPEYSMPQLLGNTKNPGADRETFVIIGAPMIKDQDFIVVKETREVHKIYNVEPALIAMGGTLVAQAATTSKIEDGSPEYRVIDW